MFLKVNSLFKSYGQSLILKGINFEVEKSEFVSLLGPSGCGKTTTLRCIAGLERPDANSGAMTLNSQILSSNSEFINPHLRHFGMVFQSYAVWPHMNVFENVAFPLRMQKKERREIESSVLEVLSLVHLNGSEKKFGHELSGGQQQRVALARALAMKPQILLLDEPLSNLDVLLREELRVEIQRIQKTLKLTTILVTHDQREALSLSDRIIILNGGKIEAQGTPHELFKAPPTEFVSEFLLGAQRLHGSDGKSFVAVPRSWKRNLKGANVQNIKVISKLYLGNEYEYWGASVQYKEPFKFYLEDSLEIGSEIQMGYSAFP